MKATIVALGRRQRITLTIGLMAVGAALGALVGFILECLLALGRFSGVFGIAAHPGELVGILITTGLGLLLGGIAAGSIAAESLHAEISNREINLRWNGASVRVRKDLIRAIHIGEDLVLYADNGAELARVHTNNPLQLQCALIHHGYPTPTTSQLGEDEFSCDYEALDDRAQRILRARTDALRAGNLDTAEIFRRQLAAMGVMIRDRRMGRTGMRTEFRRVDPFQNPSVNA